LGYTHLLQAEPEVCVRLVPLPLHLIANLALVTVVTAPFADAQVSSSGLNQWTLAAAMNTARAQACSAILLDGSMLVAGGVGSSGPVNTAEIYGTGGTFTVTSPMHQARAGAACATLKDGTVLVMGGDDGTGALSTAEIFNPSTQTWKATGNLNAAREGHQAVVNGWGAVWIAGGTNASGIVAALEEFDPPTGAFRTVGTLTTPRTEFAMALLPGLKVMIAGGTNGSATGSGTLGSVEIYNGVLGTVSVAGSMAQVRQDFAAAALPDGTVLITGGRDAKGNLLGSTEIFDPEQGVSTAGPSLLTPRAYHSAYALTNNGEVLIAGGTGSAGVLASTEAYAPWTGAIQASAPLNISRRDNVSAVLRPGSLLVAGGRNASGSLNSSELFQYVAIGTDKPDYAPGTPVNISGSGWQPGEQVSVQIMTVPVDQHHIEFTGSGIADGAGSVTVTGFAVDQSHLGMKFILTATGSQLQAQTTFTDGSGTPTITFGFSPASGTLTAGGVPVTVTVTLTGPSGTPTGSFSPCLDGTCDIINSTTTVAGSCSALGQVYTLPSSGAATCQFTIPQIPTGTTVVAIAYSGDVNYASVVPPNDGATYTVQSPTSTSLSGPSGSQPYGVTTPYIATVTVAAGNSPSGQVQFKVGGVASGSPVTLTQASATSFTASFVPSPPLLVGGPYSITASFLGDPADGASASGSISTTIVAVGTTTTEVLSANPIVYGQLLTVSGTVTSTSGGGIPSGTVTINGITGTTGCSGVTLTAAGTYSCTVATPGPPASGAPYTVVATYTPTAGTGYNTSNSGTANLTVNTAASQVSVPNVTAASGTSFTFHAQATAASPSVAPVSSGSISFWSLAGPSQSTAACATGTALTLNVTVDATGNASSGPVTLPTSTFTVCAVYTPASSNFSGSTSLGQNITSPAAQAADTVGTPTFVPVSGLFGQSVAISATVTAASSPAPGTLTFNDTSIAGSPIVGTVQTVAATGPTTAAATVTVSSLAVGTHTIIATYASSNGAFAPGMSAPGSITIGHATANFTVSSGAPNPVTSGGSVIVGTSVTLIATYTGSVSPPPSGSVNFINTNGSAIVCTATLVAGVATCNGVAGISGNLPAGAESITIGYLGDANYTLGTVTQFAFTVAKAGTTTLLVPVPNPATVGSTVTLTASVAVNRPSIAPTGTVTFVLAGNTPPATTCTGPISLTTNAGPPITYTAVCTFELAGPGGISPIGVPITYTATYSGDANTASSTGSNSLTSIRAAATTTLAATPNPATVGQTVTLTAKVSAAAAGILPTGTFSFTFSGTAPSSTTCGTPAAINAATGVATCSFVFAGPATYTATYSGDNNFLTGSGSVSVITKAAPGPISFTLSPTAPVSGQTLTLTVTVPATGSLPTPTGTVTITGNGISVTAALVNGVAVVTTGTGVGSLPVLFAGSYTLTVTYNGDSNYLAGATASLSPPLTIGKGNTTLSVSSGSSTVTVTVTPVAPATGTPTGVVTIYSGTTATGSPAASGSLVNGMFSATLNPGAQYVAVYAGDVNFNGSGPASISVARAPQPTTTTTITPSVNPPLANQPLVLTANVIGTGGSGSPTGTVTFTNNGIVIGTATLLGGVASLTTTLPVGSDTIVATYGGDSVYSGSSGSYGLTVGKPASAITFGSSPSVSVYGQPVTLTVKITQVGTAVPTGTVQFFDNGVPVGGVVTLAGGVATLTVTLPAGVNNVTVVYSGDANYGSFSGAGGTVTVSMAQILATLTANTNNGLETLTATVAVVAPGSGTPTGTVKFIDTVTGKVVGTATLAGGIASITIPVTTDPIMAVYSGDSNFSTSSSGNVSAIAVVNAASYAIGFAQDEIVTVFGAGLTTQTVTATLPLTATLGGVSVMVTDSAGTARPSLLFYVSPSQLAFLIPPGTAAGTATVTVTTASAAFTATITVTNSSPGLFTANDTGVGPLAAQVVSVTPAGAQTYTNTATLSGQTFVNAPISLTPAGNTFFLLLYGTGIRFGSVITVTINGTTYTPAYAGAQGVYAGLDQINVLLPAGLAGTGAVNVTVTVDGQVSNAGTIIFQ
jgi:hypothetical protein